MGWRGVRVYRDEAGISSLKKCQVRHVMDIYRTDKKTHRANGDT